MAIQITTLCWMLTRSNTQQNSEYTGFLHSLVNLCYRYPGRGRMRITAKSSLDFAALLFLSLNYFTRLRKRKENNTREHRRYYCEEIMTEVFPATTSQPPEQNQQKSKLTHIEQESPWTPWKCFEEESEFRCLHTKACHLLVKLLALPLADTTSPGIQPQAFLPNSWLLILSSCLDKTFQN